MRNLNDLAADIYETSTSKGFEPPTKKNIDRKLLLVVTEIAEAYEEIRDGYDLNKIYYSPEGKPEGFSVEIADAIIRLLHITYSLGIDISDVVEKKIAYNKTRPYKHGKQF